jgi:hypothetical protein
LVSCMLAIFLFLCPSAFADSVEQSELLGLMKKLNGLLDSKSGKTARAVSRSGRLVFNISLRTPSGNVEKTTLFCTATMSVVGAVSYTQARTVRPTRGPEGEGRLLCTITMNYHWPKVDPTNVIQLNVVAFTEFCTCPETPYRVSHDLPSITIPPDGITDIVEYTLVM